jgi:hypothetical protein
MVSNKNIIFIDNYIKNIQKYILEIDKEKLIFKKKLPSQKIFLALWLEVKERV